MKIRAIKTSFNGGEISKQLYGRVDLESFIASNKQMKNVLPTIYGSALNRGGTVFVSDNIKHFFEVIKSVTGATDINCVSVDYGFKHYVFGCDNGYIVRCNFEFGDILIKQLLYAGDAIGDILQIEQSIWYEAVNKYRVSTATNSYSYAPSDANWSNDDVWADGEDNKAEKLFDLSPVYFDGEIVSNNNTVASFDGLKLRFLQATIGIGFNIVARYDISDNETNDFDGWYVDDNNFVLRNEMNLYWYRNENIVQFGVVIGSILGARLQDENICVYIYKQIESKYCVCCNVYNVTGQLIKQLVLAKCDSDIGLTRAIVVGDKVVCVGTVKSVCIYRNTVFDLDFTGTCLDYRIDVMNNKILVCDGGDNINIIDSYDYSDINTKRILVPFKINKKINYILEFGEQVIRVYRNRAAVTSSGAIYEIPSPYKITDLIDDEGKLRINYVQSVDVLYICHKDFPTQTLKRYSDTNWVLEDFILVQGPFGEVNSDKNKTLVCNQTEGLITINAVNNASNLSMTNNFTEMVNIYIDNNDWKGNLTVWQLAGNTIYSSWSFLSIEQAVNALLQTADGANFIVSYSGNTINVTVKASAGSAYNGQTLLLRRFEKQQYVTTKTYTVKKYESSAAFAASSTPVDVFTNDMVGKLIRLNYTDTDTKMWESGKSITTGAIRKSGNNYYKATSSGTTGQIKPTQTSGVVSDGGVSWEYLHSGYGVGTITQVVSASQIKVNADGYFPDFTYGTYLWELGVVGGGVYPNCCSFYKERFIFSISTPSGTKICASCAGDYNNFSDNSYGDILPENAITVLLQGNQESLVLWMAALNKLYIGTACEEFVFGEQTIAEVLSPTNVMCLRVSSLGSAAIMPLHILDELFFVSNNEKQIANFTYIAERDSFRPMNISVMFEHLLHSGVKCWAYTAEPYKTIWFSDKEGNLKSISYDADNKVCAGARHNVGGKVLSLAVIPEPNGNYDELWMIVERVIDGKTVYYTERLSWGLPQEDVSDEYKNKHQIFSDCAKVFEFENNVDKVSELYFLEGRTVNVVVDGVVQQQKTVVDGTVTLDTAGKVVVVGLPYEWLIETLYINAGANDGAAQGLPQRVSKLIARVINTRYLTSKASEGNRYDVVCNNDVLTDNDYEIHLPSDYSRTMTMFFKSDKPLSCCILMCVKEMQTYQ